MKFSSLLLLLFIVSAATAQIKIDSGYTVLSAGVEDSNMTVAFLLGDLNTLMVKENASGNTCIPVSMQWTFIISSEIFQTTNLVVAKSHLPRLKPKDLIFIEKMVFNPNCFAPPKQIEITIQ
ncbi:MAG: hypothetical protein V4615_03945 [Bacteroidota bacterium]